ncbi:MAG: 50S ribosomal protein L23 [Armatimonadota bacterium]|nr:MAG: 50S ribosomal protein L23 [Armatimonadota bacterium]
MRDARDIIIRPILSEKSVAASEHDKYVFRVHLAATKVEIRNAIEVLFPDVKVSKVNTMVVRGKERRTSGYGRRRRRPGRTSNWKKAIVTLREGKIPVYEGV